MSAAGGAIWLVPICYLRISDGLACIRRALRVATAASPYTHICCEHIFSVELCCNLIRWRRSRRAQQAFRHVQIQTKMCREAPTLRTKAIATTVKDLPKGSGLPLARRS